MLKKLIIVTFILLFFTIFSFSSCFANDTTNMIENVTNDVRNAVGNTENMIQNTAEDLSNSAKNVTNNIENSANSIKNNVSADMKNSEYVASRTSTENGIPTFMGMTANTWTWLIMGIAAIAIVSLVWYYSNQIRNSNYNDNDKF